MGERLRLLAVSTAAPWPVRDGYTLRVFSLLRELSAGWAITLVAPDSPDDMRLDLAARIPVALAGPGLSYPWRFDQAGLRAAVARAAADRFDCALVWPGAESLWFGGALLPPAVADVIDCNALEFWRALWSDRGPRARLRDLRELALATQCGAQTLRHFAATACVGEADARWLRAICLGRLGLGRRVHVVPNGVDLPAVDTAEAAAPLLSFTGTLDFGPNIEAVLWAAREIWPLVRGALPAACFVIAGRRPTAELRTLHGHDGISVAADVPDMAAVLGRSWVSVAPMRSGVGVKNKVLEAWACARPVVMTPMATNGLVLPEGHAALVHRDAPGMALAILGLLRDAPARHALGRAARVHVAAHGTWRAAAAAIDTLLRAASARGLPSRGPGANLRP